MQFTSFLGSALSSDELQRRLPSLDDLLTSHYVSTDVAFALCRFTINQQITAKWEEFKKTDRKDKEKQTTSAKVRRLSRMFESSLSVWLVVWLAWFVIDLDCSLRGSEFDRP